MGKFILKRISTFIPMVLIMSFLIYGGIEMAPGDFVSKMIPMDTLARMTPEEVDAIRAAYGLDQPFVVRYLKWVWQILQGNWGTSMSSGVPVKDIILQKLPITMELALTGLVISAILGCIFGIISALVFGAGMCMAMGEIGGGMVLGILIGVIGMIGCSVNYPIYKKMREKGKAKYAFEIVQLAREITEQ